VRRSSLGLDGSCGKGSRLHLDAQAGTTYRFVVAGQNRGYNPTEQGNIVLRLRADSPPANDKFAAAQVVGGSLPIVVKANNVDSLGEPGEPEHNPDFSSWNSVWFSWTPTVSRRVVFDTCSSIADETFVAVYTGDRVDSLAAVGRSGAGCGAHGKPTVDVQAGVTYSIVLTSAYAQGPLQLVIRRPRPPANDDFANARQLTGNVVDVRGTNLDATRESAEPFHGSLGSNATVWYRWRAARAGLVTIDTCRSAVATDLAIYTGSSLPTLDEVATSATEACDGAGSKVTFQARAGQTYRIAVDGSSRWWEVGDHTPEGAIRIKLRA
jgi:hypothetical protein